MDRKNIIWTTCYVSGFDPLLPVDIRFGSDPLVTHCTEAPFTHIEFQPQNIYTIKPIIVIVLVNESKKYEV